MYHSHIKHIDIRYNCLCQAIKQKLFKLEKNHIDENMVDIMTKVIVHESSSYVMGWLAWTLFDHYQSWSSSSWAKKGEL